MRRSALSLALIGVLLLSVAAAAGTVAGAGPAAGTGPATVAANSLDTQVFGTGYAPAAGTSGGTLTAGDWQYPNALNPYYAWSLSAFTAAAPILRGCAALTPDGKYVPDLCASLPSDSNGDIAVSGSTFTVTLHLRPGLAWSDGQPLTANDLKYTWRWASDAAQKNCYGCYAWSAITAIDVSTDGLTATVHFGHLTSDWLPWLTSVILPEHYMTSIPIADAAKDSYPLDPGAAAAPTSGPFKVSSVSATEIDFVRNDRFTAGVAPSHQGGAYLAGLAFKYYDNPIAEIDALKAGAIDLALGLNGSLYSSLKTTPASVAGAVVTPARQYELLALNNDPSHARKNGLWDLNVRKALATAVNKRAIASLAVPGANLAAPCVPVGANSWYAKSESCPAFSVSAAQALLTKAGWRVDANGWVAKAGREMNLTICTTQSSARIAEAKAVAAALKKVHVKSTVKAVNFAVFFGAWSDTAAKTPCSLARGTYDLAIFSYSFGTSPASQFGLYRSSEWPEKGQHYGQNVTRFASKAMDAAANHLVTDVNLASQLADANKAQDAYATGFPEIALYYTPSAVGVGVHVGNFAGISGDGVIASWNVEDWFVKP